MGDEDIAGVLSFIGVKVNTIFSVLGYSLTFGNKRFKYVTMVFQKYLSTDRLLGTTRELALILNM
jgi:hypothetical protein